jgi:hypothetical protein
MLALVLNCIDRLNIYNSVAHFAGIAREESGMAWKEVLNLLYKLLGRCACCALSWETSKGIQDSPATTHNVTQSALVNHLILTPPFMVNQHLIVLSKSGQKSATNGSRG